MLGKETGRAPGQAGCGNSAAYAVKVGVTGASGTGLGGGTIAGASLAITSLILSASAFGSSRNSSG